MSYYIGCFKKYAQFSGRARRMEYWYFVLIDWIVIWVFMILGAFVGGRAIWLLYMVYIIGSIVPRLAVLCRRMHDTDHAGGWMFFPIVNFLIALTNGTPGDNRFGPNPRFTSGDSALGNEKDFTEKSAYESVQVNDNQGSKVALIIGLIAVPILMVITSTFVQNPEYLNWASDRIDSTSVAVAETPSQAAEVFMTAVKEQDMDTISEVYLGDAYEMDLIGVEEDETIPADISELLSDKMQEFEYEILEETVNGTTATVDVEITTVNIGGAFEDAINGLMVKAEAGGLADDVTEEEITEMLYESFKNNLSVANKDYQQTVQLELTKEDDAWMVDIIPEDGSFINALTGGLIEYSGSL